MVRTVHVDGQAVCWVDRRCRSPCGWCCCRILVGVILSALGLDPWNIWRSLQNLVRAIWDMGFDAIWWLWRYFLLGAVIVIPIWLIVRLAKGGRGVNSYSRPRLAR